MIKSLVINKYANRLARIIYYGLGYVANEGFDFSKSEHPTEIAMRNLGYDIANILLSHRGQMDKLLGELEKNIKQ